MRDKKELEKSLRYFRHKAEYTVESDERKEMYVIAAEAVEKVLNPDFVEVVRCRDCKHRRQIWTAVAEKRYGGTLCECEYADTLVPLDHFCSYGERREEG